MNNVKNQEYLKKEKFSDEKIVRTEIIFTPLLVVAPLLVGFFLIYDWYIRDFLWNDLNLLGELILGFIIIVGNILFDIPFIKSLKSFSKEKQ
jgi:hypothetical protein